MLNADSISFLESITISGLGLAVVFTTLIVLALAIIVISKIITTFIKEGQPKAAAIQPVVDNSEKDNEAFAILMAVISEDLNLPTDQFRIVSIKEV